ncbi:MAG: ABC transporter ATP-binding protein [Fimbriimonadaceae bacterium]|nr:ABC transporter ATP-binding protein [Fimbriimonadaceae bacterium]MBZ0214666.1 ABC transporter ATP-binding protein [Fimbriimonadaceae bacterium]
MAVAEIRNLTVRYGNFTALDDFSATIPEGCVGLLGPNGAGKTTLIKTLLGFVAPADGGGSVLGHDIRTEGRYIRQKIGLMPEQDCHIPGMSAVMFVAFAGELAGMPKENAVSRAHEVLEYCGLGEARYRNVETYSTGMKQRIKLAQALVHGPKLLLLDEPTNGLDPQGREEMLELIRSISHGKGVNVLVSSHLLKDIERTCDEVVVVAKGQLRASGAIKDLKELHETPLDVELLEPSPAFEAAVAGQGGRVVSVESYHYRVVMPGSDSAEMTGRVFQAAVSSKVQVRAVVLAQRSLEDAFMEVVHE